jgi:hypothetical protein
VTTEETGPQPCPFCGGTYAAQLDDMEGNGQVVHTIPTCAQWVRLKPIDFLIAAREARGIFLPS